MIRNAREKIASKVSKLEVSDDFHFAKWLRVPKFTTADVTELLLWMKLRIFLLNN